MMIGVDTAFGNFASGATRVYNEFRQHAADPLDCDFPGVWNRLCRTTMPPEPVS